MKSFGEFIGTGVLILTMIAVMIWCFLVGIDKVLPLEMYVKFDWAGILSLSVSFMFFILLVSGAVKGIVDNVSTDKRVMSALKEVNEVLNKQKECKKHKGKGNSFKVESDKQVTLNG